MIINGNSLAELKVFDANSIDSLVTDPPAGISFMGKEWDGDKGGRDAWVTWMTEVMTDALRVLKPGAHGLVWAIPRTSPWTMTALENAGFEVRDVVTHLFGTGFPKSLDVSKAIDKAAGAEREVIGYDAAQARPNKEGFAKVTSAIKTQGNAGHKDNGATITAPSTDDAKRWQGFGTALKPACEFWVLVRKPCSEKTVAANVLKWGTGALNIDASRIGTTDTWSRKESAATSEVMVSKTKDMSTRSDIMYRQKTAAEMPAGGRFPANLVLDEEAAAALDEQSGTLKSGDLKPGHKQPSSAMFKSQGTIQRTYGGDSGGASRFFYVAKASKSDKGADNVHPTVKSTALMSYLIKLITPPNGLVLDPFMGSGSTGVAALREGFEFIGIEQESQYAELARKRMEIA